MPGVVEPSTRSRATRKTLSADAWIVVGLVVCVLAAAGAMAALWKEKTTPGPVGRAPGVWPADSRIERNPSLPTLVMFAHPFCPCTRASLSELREVMSRFDGRVQANVLFVRPDGVGDEWSHSDTWRGAASIPGVHVAEDARGIEARLFDATTSGQVVVYDEHGRLQFSGGITPERGHVGSNPGRVRVAGVLAGDAGSLTECPVFGCPLLDRK